MFREKNILLELVSQSLSFKTLSSRYKQIDSYRCGYFCAKALINSIGRGFTLGLGPSLNLTRDGVRQSNLVKTLRNRGVSASVRYDLDRKKLEKYLSKDKYIIVYHHAHEHWMILCDMDKGWMRIYNPEENIEVVHYNSMKKHLRKFGILCTSKHKK